MPSTRHAGLHWKFHGPEHFRSARRGYRLLPMRFAALDERRYVATNLAGEYVVLARETLERAAQGTLEPSDPSYADLVARHFVLESGDEVALDLLATKVRTKLAPLSDFTGLHIFVVTLRCDHSCQYCQVSRVSADRVAYDMSEETADRAVDLLFQSPNPYLKVEFQGGEPLLNFPLVERIVRRVKERGATEGRNVEFVLATNLSQLTDPILEFCREHKMVISTSLDGPKALHDTNRRRPEGDAYERTVAGIHRCREVLGPDSVAALMTTTRASLEQPEAIIDEYVALGFHSVFLRWMSPFGFAGRAQRALGYDAAAWNRFYERGLRRILDWNRRGVPFREELASIVLRKMLTPFATHYVDLQSPAGLGLSVVVYNYDGDVYASDEARMLAETGDKTFRLGNVHRDRYEDIFLGEKLLDILLSTMTEGTPSCTDCPFEPYCGAQPTFHHATQGDMAGHRPSSAFCHRNLFLFRLLVRLLEDEPETRDVLASWAV